MRDWFPNLLLASERRPRVTKGSLVSIHRWGHKAGSGRRCVSLFNSINPDEGPWEWPYGMSFRFSLIFSEKNSAGPSSDSDVRIGEEQEPPKKHISDLDIWKASNLNEVKTGLNSRKP